MCLGAIYWARPDRVVFAGSRVNAADAGFDDQLIYDELVIPFAQRRIPMIQGLQEEAVRLFDAWNAKPDKLRY
jgi:tRNA(Arg) A34 adenosine deaminase TadA